jgi:chromate transporter
VAAIVLQAAHRIGSRALKHGAHWAIAAAAFVAVFALNVPFPVIVISAAITGFIGGRIAPENFTAAAGITNRRKPPLMLRLLTIIRPYRRMPCSAGRNC